MMPGLTPVSGRRRPTTHRRLRILSTSPARGWRSTVWGKDRRSGRGRLGRWARARPARDGQLLLSQCLRAGGGRARRRRADRLPLARRTRRHCADIMPAMFVPLQELENLAPGSWYVNVLAAYPERARQGPGHGPARPCRAASPPRPACAASASSSPTPIPGARRLYERSGYREVARRRKVKEDWHNPGTDWVLLVKRA